MKHVEALVREGGPLEYFFGKGVRLYTETVQGATCCMCAVHDELLGIKI